MKSNYRNFRVQETARIRNTTQTMISQTQLHDDRANNAHGYRSLGFYQCARELPAATTSFIVGPGNGTSGTLVS